MTATDGIVVVSVDGVKVFAVNQFKTMDEVKEFEKAELAKAEVAEKQKLEASKININGSGDTASDALPLKAGFAIFEGENKGGSNFAVHLQDSNGNNLELLVNTIGSYKGKTFAMIPNDGDYYLNITSSGQWNYSISQFVPFEMPDAPSVIEGSGDDVVFVNAKSGNYKLSFNNTGESNFVVLLNGGDLLVNEIGSYQGSTRKNLSTDGPYAFVVKSDGNWSINIEK